MSEYKLVSDKEFSALCGMAAYLNKRTNEKFVYLGDLLTFWSRCKDATVDSGKADEQLRKIMSQLDDLKVQVSSLLIAHNSLAADKVRLVNALVAAKEAISNKEININNYSHEDVCEMNGNFAEAYHILHVALLPTSGGDDT